MRYPVKDLSLILRAKNSVRNAHVIANRGDLATARSLVYSARKAIYEISDNRLFTRYYVQLSTQIFQIIRRTA